MTSKVTPITSSAHFKGLVASSTYVVVDFYADWCGPCKQISPIFEQLAAQESKPGRIIFVKVNVDNQRDVASTYGISAMPTFLILKGTKTVETVRGANPTALRSAILSAAADAARGPAKQNVSFSGKGQTLGSEGSKSSTTTRSNLPTINFGQLFSAPGEFAQGRGFPQMIVRFLGLYISTLLSFDPMQTAEESPFAIKRGMGNVRTRTQDNDFDFPNMYASV